MKKIVSLAIVCVIAMMAYAVPARRGWQTCTQADGTTIEVQQLGDEYYHYWTTKDGKVAIQQEDGTFTVSDEQEPSSEQISTRRRASGRYVNRAKKVGAAVMPARALFILVSFSNQTFKDASTTYYKSKLGDTTEGAMSMYNYLKEQSNGQYAPPVDVYGPVTLNQQYSYYGANDSRGDDKNPAQMIVDACKGLDSEIDFSKYDANNDGIVDNVYIIYAGKGEADGGAANTVWPHQWDIAGASLTCTLDGKSIRSYACSSELNGSGKYAMGTPLHEFGHVIGLPDYYDTEYASSNYEEARTPGEWSIMDGGSYNDDGNTPPNYSIFDKYYLGWCTPKFLAKDEQKTVTLTTTEYGDGYQINGGTSLLPYTNTKTIYYIENRQKSGWDAALPGHGMIVWQVKYSSSSWENNDLNNTGGSPRYTVLSASGDPKNIGKTTDPFPGTGKVTTCTLYTGCELTEITEANKLITFKFNGGDPVDPFTITWYADGVEFATTESTGKVVLPAEEPTACGDRVFIGWCANASYESATKAPTLVKAGDAVAEGAKFYAIFATQTEGSGDASFDGETGGTFKIYADVDGTKYYATATVSNNKVQSATDEASAADFVLTPVTGGFTIQTGGKYLGHGSGTNVSLSNSAYTWAIEPGTKGSWRVNSTTSTGRALAFRASTYNVFGGYATGNINGTEYFDLEIGGGSGASRSDYSTKSGCGTTGIEDTMVERPAAVKVIREGRIVIIRGDEEFTITGERIR